MGEPREPGVPTPEDGAALVALAVAAIADRLRGVEHTPGVPASGCLVAPGASFVTLERQGRLRGCIGTLEARRPLYLDVVRNAGKAMTDPRMPPVTVADWPELEVKVAVLTSPVVIEVAGLDGLLTALTPGIDGLLLTDAERRSTFLPAVWGKLPDPRRFVEALLAKGGWRCWSADIRAYRYASVDFTDRSPRPPL